MRPPPGYEPALFLFTPRGEKLWADGWDPLFPAPADDDTEPGTVFETLHGQQRTTWVVCARDALRSVRYARIAHGRDAGTVTVTLDDGAAVPGEPRVATVEYDLTALTGEAATGLARFTAGTRSTCSTGKRRSRTPPEPGRPGTPVVPDDGPGLFTIGHSNQALDHFLSLLQRHGIGRGRRAHRSLVPLRAAVQRQSARRGAGQRGNLPCPRRGRWSAPSTRRRPP